MGGSPAPPPIFQGCVLPETSANTEATPCTKQVANSDLGQCHARPMASSDPSCIGLLPHPKRSHWGCCCHPYITPQIFNP